jgi:hypothetical protein
MRSINQKSESTLHRTLEVESFLLEPTDDVSDLQQTKFPSKTHQTRRRNANDIKPYRKRDSKAKAKKIPTSSLGKKEEKKNKSG